MQGQQPITSAEFMERLINMSKPKRSTEKFREHPYMEGRLNDNHFNDKLHGNSFCPTVRELAT
jgi:hypothetical protein